MTELLQVGMLVPAGAAACCAAAPRRGRAAALIPALVMLAAMLDHGLAGLLQRAAIIPAALWFVALLGCAMVAVLPLRAARVGAARTGAARAGAARLGAARAGAARLGAARAGEARVGAARAGTARTGAAMAVHRALSCIAMAALLLVTETPHRELTGAAAHVMTGGVMSSGGFLEVLLATEVVGVTALGTVLALRHRHTARLGALDASAMSLSLVLMFAGHAMM